ncbi:dipeptide epimerase [Rhodohalobacter sp. SW132]|uniref:N-acetyl-D-Glu racemase DgcA n=1 Tax=Rhodohalobacter sp. SW132 TaxID=2293433 RepID=UPI000E236569|nr:N-acetyl-D-Glu racemase DgcA [Rhodohalobacter sp. SW132]REL39211.1 dipeptide epimerase [Rhodohalobacter sp. SW132]
MANFQVNVWTDSFPLAEVFTIARGSRTHAEVLTAEITADGIIGRGECVPYSRYDETLQSVTEQIQSLPSMFTRTDLQDLLPAGAARNVVDCALWDLEAKSKNLRVWQLAGLEKPIPQITAFTLSLDTPERMQAAAKKHSFRPLLKIKLGTPDDMPRLEAVRKGAPKSDIIVDANEGWTADVYKELAPHLLRLGVKMVEQPLPASDDALLEEIERPLPVCADESCHDRQSLPALKDRYDMVNIKLDKTGGLTEALALRDAAIKEGYSIMVGCMVGSSLAMAPALLVAQGVEIVDLDGPLLLAEDRDHPLHFDENGIHPFSPELWG